MSYEAVEGRAQSLLQLLTSMFATSAQVTRGDWGVLDSGVDRSAVLYPGAFEQRGSGSNGSVVYIWTVQLDLFQRWQATDAATISAFIALRDAVIQHLQKYPSLNGLAGVYAVGNIAGGETIYLFESENSGPFSMKETLVIPVTDLVTVTLAES